MLGNVLSEEGYTVLIVDSDESNPGLYRMLGFNLAPKPVMELFGGGRKVIEELNKAAVTEAEPMARSLLGNCISLKDISPEFFLERDGLRLMSIGKITQAFEGCACPINLVSKMFLEKLALKEREVALVDMEAGVEHFGRGVDKGIDTMLIVVEPSFESIALAAKINVLGQASGVKDIWAILNKIPSPQIEGMLRDELAKRGVRVIGSVRYDCQLSEECLQGRMLGESEAKQDIRRIVDTIRHW